VEFTTTETTSYRLVGLSHTDTNQSYNTLDFAIYLTPNGNLSGYVGATYLGILGTYATGDVLRVAIESGVVKYKKNGTVFYTATPAPNYPLMVDTALYTNGATISNVVISSAGGGSGGGAGNVGWTNTVGVSAATNNLTKTAADGWGNAGAVSTQTIASGDGYVEFTASETTSYRLVGLSHTDTNQSYNTIDYAIYLQPSGTLSGYVGATHLGTLGTYATGDVLRVAIEGGGVKYKKNGTVFYTATTAPNYPLMVDTSLYTNGATINNVVLSGASGGGSSSAQIHWLVTDQLGTPRMVFDQTGSLANMSRHDYLPFGEEIYAGTGGRTVPQGYTLSDNVRQKFTSKERDNETGLDFFEARYYASTQGRFTSPDEFWKDSQVGDPQSWNKYAYVRNNPLRYIDPEGEKATVTIETDEERKKGKITVKGSIALWTNKGFSKEEMQKAAAEYKANIEKAWSGTYEQDGIKYEVTTTVDVQVYGSEREATDSGAQNVLRVVEEGGHSYMRERSVYDVASGGPDRGQLALDAGRRNSEAAHEFTHVLGVDNRYSGKYLSNTYGAQRAMTATGWDYAWAFGGEIQSHRAASRAPNPVPLGIRNRAPAARGYGAPRSHRSTREVGAAFYWWR
jgi:RHS repeat-associated protein